MSEQPWLTDPKYGGMSELAARRSYEAWVKQGSKPLRSGESEEAIARRFLAIEDLFEDYRRASAAYVAWMQDWVARRPKGFRGIRRRS